MIGLLVNGQPVSVASGTTVAAAVLAAGLPLPALCGMGVCYQCGVRVDGEWQAKTCQMPCRDGMQVVVE